MEDQLQDQDAAIGGPYKGNELLSWLVDEYQRYERGVVWYSLAVGFGLFFLAYAVLTQNFLFALLVLMFAIVFGLSAMLEPRKIVFVVTDLGVGIGDKFIPFKELKNFWMLYEPPEVKNIYLEFKRSVRPHIVVPLYDQNPVQVREHLIRFMEEDLTQEEEPTADYFGRLFKL